MRLVRSALGSRLRFRPACRSHRRAVARLGCLVVAAAATIGSLATAMPADAADLIVTYDVNGKKFKKKVTSDASLVFELHTEATCSGPPAYSEILLAGSPQLLVEKVPVQRLKDENSRPPKTYRLRATLGAPDLDGQLYLLVDGVGVKGIPETCQLQTGLFGALATGPQGPPGPGAGTFTISVDAETCVLRSQADDSGTACTGGGTSRTEGGTQVACLRQGEADVLQELVCPVPIRSGAVIEEVRLYGTDNASDSYVEAGIYRHNQTSFGVNYISSGFGGSWQTSGLAETPGTVDIPIFSTADTPHEVEEGFRYKVGVGLKGGSARFYGLRFQYRIDP